MYDNIKKEAEAVVEELLEVAKLDPKNILVIGCSSSEVMGENIGHGSSVEAAEAIFEGVYPILKIKGIFLAVQCCEHLNRAIVVEKECAEKYELEQVCVMPHPHAGGSFATTAYKKFNEPVVVEEIQAHAGIDIGDTLIGMHLRRVAVPVRIKTKKIGEANVVCARTRPKLIGGARALYPEDNIR